MDHKAAIATNWFLAVFWKLVSSVTAAAAAEQMDQSEDQKEQKEEEEKKRQESAGSLVVPHFPSQLRPSLL